MSILDTTSLSDIASLDVRIDYLGRQLAEIRRQRNALVPIASRIPNEILAEIFEWARAVCNYGWLAFSHVSHVWREVALMDVRLWTSVDVSCPQLASELLGRTGGAALSLYSSTRARQIRNPVLSALWPVMEQVLSANATGQRVNTIRLDILLTSMLARVIRPRVSHLETLDLDTNRSSRVRSVTNAVQSLEIPSLRNLRLRGWSLDWTSLMVTSAAARLRTMEIIYTGRSDSTSTPADMCAAFRLMTLLEVLVMEYSIPKEGWKDFAPISMPRLRSVQLEDIPRACLSLLQLLHKPETCQTKVLTSPVEGTEDDVDRLVSCLGIPTPQRISVRLSTRGMAVTTTAYTTLHSHSPHHWLHINFESAASADIMRSLGNLLADLPQSTLLDVDASDLSRLWCYSLSGTSSASVVEIDWAKCGGDKDEGTVASTAARWTTVFPNMRTLALKHMNFEQVSKEVIHAIKQDVLLERRAAGTLEVVRLFRCSRVPRDVWEGWHKLLLGVEIVECELLDAPAEN